MRKTFTACLNVTTTNANVIAELGAFADAMEERYGRDLTGMALNTDARGYWPEEFEGPCVVGAFAHPLADPDAAPPKPKRGRPKKVVEPKADTQPTTDPAPEESAVEGDEAEVEVEEAAPTATDAPPAVEPPTRDDGFSALRALIDAKGNDAAKAALKSIGHIKFSDVPTESMIELLAAVQEQLA